jgi:hypothetical protein
MKGGTLIYRLITVKLVRVYVLNAASMKVTRFWDMRSVVWQKLSDGLKVLTTAIIRAMMIVLFNFKELYAQWN